MINKIILGYLKVIFPVFSIGYKKPINNWSIKLSTIVSYIVTILTQALFIKVWIQNFISYNSFIFLISIIILTITTFHIFDGKYITPRYFASLNLQKDYVKNKKKEILAFLIFLVSALFLATTYFIIIIY